MAVLLYGSLPPEVWEQIFGMLPREEINKIYEIIPSTSHWIESLYPRIFRRVTVFGYDRKYPHLGEYDGEESLLVDHSKFASLCRTNCTSFMKFIDIWCNSDHSFPPYDECIPIENETFDVLCVLNADCSPLVSTNCPSNCLHGEEYDLVWKSLVKITVDPDNYEEIKPKLELELSKYGTLLKHLRLRSKPEKYCADLSFELKHLQSLDLCACNIAKFPHLDKLDNLKSLNLGINNVSKIERLSTLHNLSYLELRSNKIEKLVGLEGLVNLEFLDLSDNYIVEVVGLDTLSNLKTLDFSGNQIYELRNGLNELKCLEYLCLSGNKITDLEGCFNGCQNLEYLALGANQIPILNGLDRLQKVKFLDLSQNLICKIENLEALTSLQTIDLSNNYITKIENFDALGDCLQNINLGSNRFRRIENLERMVNMKTLDLEYCKIKKIEGLDLNKLLESLLLSSNKISVIENLDSLAKLKLLDLGNNLISNFGNMDKLYSLKELIIHGNKDPFGQLELLLPLKNLETLSLGMNGPAMHNGFIELKKRKQINKLGLSRMTKLTCVRISELQYFQREILFKNCKVEFDKVSFLRRKYLT